MKLEVDREACECWDLRACEALIAELWNLRSAMLDHQARLQPLLDGMAPAQRASAANLAHYLAMRRFDLRRLQERLTWIGVSSLGRAETHVLANLDKVLGILHRLAGRPWTPQTADEPTGFRSGRERLELHAEALFGAAPSGRQVRIMVTLPSEDASDDALITSLVASGMDIARINCAHDDAPAWARMADRVRQAARHVGRPVRILMDLGGPKLRTGPLEGGQAIVKLKPERSAPGRGGVPARLGLRPSGAVVPVPGAQACLGVDAGWLAHLKTGDRIDLTDARAARRELAVIERLPDGSVLLESRKKTHLADTTRLHRHRPGHGPRDAVLTDFPPVAGQLHLHRGDTLHLVTEGLGHDAVLSAAGVRTQPATISCTLPEALRAVRKGERIWFDDGRIGGVVLRKGSKRVEVEITHAREGGERLAADKGINLPDTRLDLPALTDKDLQDLGTVVKHADMVGLSFAQSAADVHGLQRHLAALGAPQLGLVLKIETKRGFEHLPEMLLAAMGSAAAGVMIARGDLAVECGYERMAEVQEEILWACEAAHMPVVWATQVLETLAKTGLPSRSEITDAAMGERAECVMLNKGPHILDAMRTLDDILRRMQNHQAKKRPLLRALTAWMATMEGEQAPAGAATAPVDRPCMAAQEGSGPVSPRADDRAALRRSRAARQRSQP